MNASWLNEMTAVQEAFDTWKVQHYDDQVIPTNGIVKTSILDNNKRLAGEIGYYRMWSINGSKPNIDINSDDETFAYSSEAELVRYPGGIQDLYYLDTDRIGYNTNKQYIIDATNSVIYSISGGRYQGRVCYSLFMSKTINGKEIYIGDFVEAEVSIIGNAGNIVSKYETDENGNWLDKDGNITLDESEAIPNPLYSEYGFKFISSPNSNNIYKLYNNGDLYGKGLKGIGLQTSKEKMDKIDSTVFKELTIPEEIPSCKKLIPGSTDTIYVIDNKDNLWAWGNNNSNKLGLTQKQQNSYTGREPVQINVGGIYDEAANTISGSKSVYNVFDSGNCLFVVTTDNELYACGQNSNSAGAGYLGLGHTNEVNVLTKVEFNDPKNIIFMCGSSQNGTRVWYNNAPNNLTQFSKEWCAYNQFYISTNSMWIGFAGTKASYINANKSKFVRIMNGGDSGDDIDQDVVNIWSTSWGTLKLDETYLQCEYLNAGLSSGGAGGGSNTGDWMVRPEAQGKKFVKMWRNGSKTVLLDDGGKLWGCGHNRQDLGYTGNPDWVRDWVLDEIPNVPFNTNQLKDVILDSSAALYLLNDGTIWATGGYSSMGLGQDWSGNVIGWKNVTSNFPALNGFYGGTFNDGKSELVKNKVLNISSANNIFIGTDGKLYMTNSPTLVFRDLVVEKSWTVVARNVKDFCANENSYICYVDKSNRLYVAGEDSTWLGLDYATPTKIKYWEEVTNSKVQGKVKKAVWNSCHLYVLSTDNKLWVSGHGYYDQNFPGIDNTTDTKDFVKVYDGVKDVETFGGSTLVLGETNNIYGWGHWRSWCNTGNTKTISSTYGNNHTTVQMLPTMRGSAVIDSDGNMWFSSENDWGNWWGQSDNIGDYKIWTGDGSKAGNSLASEGFRKVLRMGHDYYCLTRQGNLYGWGPKSYLGINSTSSGDNYEIYKLDLTNVDDIVCGNGWCVCVLKDGRVFGTGKNLYGVLGRWMGTARSTANSRYQTAFEWVECPELEI